SVTAADALVSGGGNITIDSSGNIEMTNVNAGGGSINLTATGTINGGTFTGGSGTVNASTAGLSSPTTANVSSLRVNLTSQDATGVSGKFDKGANLITAPSTDQINGPGTILITGFPAYFPEDVDDPMAELAALSSISGEQAILEMILALSRETEFFMAPPLMLSIAADEVDATLGKGAEEVREPCRDDDEECKERMKK
ncbi:MAG: hypothetical protein QG578_1045, partial [Thermodesulfobacteriota bacterium]|nr:hypothetical protein [Thermodesulfobacteriota bacterium]